MPIIAVFYGDFCRADSVVREVFDRSGHRLITDANVIDEAVEHIRDGSITNDVYDPQTARLVTSAP